MKQAITLMLGICLVFSGVGAHAEDTYKLTESAAVQKIDVKREVERREHASVSDVEIVGAGKAKAQFNGGVAEIRFTYSPLTPHCPTGQDRECLQQVQDNPLGFKVLSYKSHGN